MVGKPAEFMLENIAHKFNLRREQVGRRARAAAEAAGRPLRRANCKRARDVK